ncbi:hypothetical protein WCQ02_31120 [Paraburkholderia tropica]|uniref:hypothetical protein n=1 Tax=Paraburkholderia tropica TaxID=92647 RepID=UPI00301A1A43
MTARGKIIDDAVWKILGSWRHSPDPRAIEEIIAGVFDAGRSETPDLDAARWRVLESEFGGLRAKFSGYRAVNPTLPRTDPFGPTSMSASFYSATEWRLDCAWIDVSGSADTIPKIVTQMLGKKRGAAA